MRTGLDWSSIPQKRVFSAAEFHARIASVQAGMARRGIDVLVVTDASNFYYLTGYDTLALHDFMCAIVPASGDPSVIINEFHEGLYSSLSGYWPVQLFSEFDDPVDIAVSLVSKVAPHTIAVEANWPHQVKRLSQRLESSTTSIVDAFGIVEDARVVKTDEEVAHMTRVAVTTQAGASAAMAAIGEGVLDHEIASAAMSAMLAVGSEFPVTCPIVCAGYRGGIPYSTFDGYQLMRGDAVFVEQTGSLRHYAAPLMRSAIVGEPNAEISLAGRVTSQALDVIMATARHGVSSRDVAEAAMGVLVEGLEGRAFHNIIGYPVGIASPPSWVEPLGYSITMKSDFELRRGMTFHLPMSLRKPGEWAIGLSQTIVVADHGSTALAVSPARLFQSM